MPAMQAAVDRTYESAIAALPDSAVKTAGIETGERAAAAVLAARADDGAGSPAAYHPPPPAPMCRRRDRGAAVGPSASRG